jgi:hypothetical protein
MKSRTDYIMSNCPFVDLEARVGEDEDEDELEEDEEGQRMSA